MTQLRSGLFPLISALVVASACSTDLMPSDTIVGTGGTSGAVQDENSDLCAPFEAAESGGAMFPPEDATAVRYGCVGEIDIEISGVVCISEQLNGSGCDFEIEMQPQGSVSEENFIGVPSPTVVS